MIKQHRHLVAAIAATGLLALVSVSVHADDGTDAFRFLPKDTALVLSADVPRLGKSSAAGALFNAVANDSDFAEVNTKLTSAGVNLARDIDSVVLAMAGDIENKERIVLVIKGRLDATKVLAFLKKDAQKSAVKKHLSTSYYLLDDDNEVAFIDGYLVSTPKGGMTRVIDVYKGKATSVRKNPRFIKLARRNQHKSALWIALDLPRDLRKQIAGEADGHSINSVIVGVDMTKEVNLSMSMVTSSQKTARALALKLRDASTNMAKDPALVMVGLSESFKRMTVKESGVAIDVTISISSATVQQVLTVLKSSL